MGLGFPGKPGYEYGAGPSCTAVLHDHRQAKVCRSLQRLGIPVPKDTQPTGTMFHIRINKRTIQNPLPISPGQVWGPVSRDTPRTLVPKGRQLHSQNSAGPGRGPEFVFSPPEGRAYRQLRGNPVTGFTSTLKGEVGVRGAGPARPRVSRPEFLETT